MADIDLHAAFEAIFGPVDWDNLPTPTTRQLEREAHVANGGTLRPDSEHSPFVPPRAGRTPLQVAELGHLHHGHHLYTWEPADE